MTILSGLRGRIEQRYLLVYRVDPAAAAPLLPDDSTPLVYRGSTLVTLCLTRQEAPWNRIVSWPRRTRDHMAWRVPVERGDPPRRAVWVARRETSSWLAARFSGALTRGTYRHARFAMRDDGARIDLAVALGGGTEVLSLRARRTGELRGSIFATARQAHEYLAFAGPVHPPDPLAPMLDRLDVGDGWSVEPLEVETMHVPRFEDLGLFPEGTVEFDSLFQLTQVQRVGLRRLALVEDDGLELATPTSG